MKTNIKPPLLYQIIMLFMIVVFYVFPNTRVRPRTQLPQRLR